MDVRSRQPRQQSGRAGGVKVNAKIKVKLCKPAFLPFEKALLYARSLKLKTQKEWQAWRMTGARPANIPSRPDLVYTHDGWQGWGHWLGTGNVCGGNGQQFLPFKEALLHARSLKLKSPKEWKTWCKSGVRPANIPASPDKTYKHEGWQGYGHWLGTSTVAPKDQKFLPFKEALVYARFLKLQSQKRWKTWCKNSERPANIPAGPDITYKHEGWNGWGHWLGTGNVGVNKDQQFLPFKKALLYAHSLELTSNTEWREWCKTSARPVNIPSNPEAVYKHDGWQGYGYWLGTGNVAAKEFLPFKQALLYARSLRLKGQKGWQAWRKSGERAANVPSTPDRTYKHDGWQGYGHWLGTGTVATKHKQSPRN